MIKHIAITATLLTALMLALMVAILPVPEQHDETELTVIQNVRLMKDGGLTEPNSVILKAGLIDAIEPGPFTGDAANIIDGGGLTIIPGLIDAHTHSYAAALKDALTFGVTTSLDMFSDPSGLEPARKTRNALSRTESADLYSAGMLATAPGGHGTQFGVKIDTLTGPDQAEDWVATRKAEGSDFIKLVYMPDQSYFQSLDRATARAVIKAAKQNDLLVVAHISTKNSARDMIEDGIDGLVHIFADVLADDEIVALAAENSIFIIPTLSVIASVDNKAGELNEPMTERFGDLMSDTQIQSLGAGFPVSMPGFSYDIALQNVKLFFDAGVPILAGSDAPNPGTAHGISVHLEMQRLVEAGLTPEQAVAAATRLPADIFSLQDRGRLQPGTRADFLLIQGDPGATVTESLNIKKIFKNGFDVTPK